MRSTWVINGYGSENLGDKPRQLFFHMNLSNWHRTTFLYPVPLCGGLALGGTTFWEPHPTETLQPTSLKLKAGVRPVRGFRSAEVNRNLAESTRYIGYRVYEDEPDHHLFEWDSPDQPLFCKGPVERKR